jgi:hypothetical protein
MVYAIKDYLVEYSYNALLEGIQSYLTNLHGVRQNGIPVEVQLHLPSIRYIELPDQHLRCTLSRTTW